MSSSKARRMKYMATAYHRRGLNDGGTLMMQMFTRQNVNLKNFLIKINIIVDLSPPIDT